MTIASGRINSQSKHDLICHVAKVKATTSAYSMATKYLFNVFIILFESNAQTKRKYIFHRIKNTISVILSVYLCFNNVWSKHYRLRDSKLADRKKNTAGRLWTALGPWPRGEKKNQQQQQKQNKELWLHKAYSLRELRFPAEMSFSNITVLHQEEG